MTLIRMTVTVKGQPLTVLMTDDRSTIVCVDPDTCLDTSCPSLTGVL